jgi:hypothetical protein
MAGLNLSGAIDGYQQGVQWKQQQDAQQRLNEANSAFKDTLAQRQKAHEQGQMDELANWVQSGKSGDAFQAKPWQPGDLDYLQAAQARQTKLAQSGDYDNYVKSAAAMAPMVTQYRQKALQEYGNDEAALAKAVYPTFMDGREVTSADYVDGTGPNGKKGARQLRLNLSDGSTQILPEGQLSNMVKQSTMNPQQQLAEANYLYDLKKKAFEADQTRQTEGMKQEGRLKLEDTKAGYAKDLAGVNNGYRLGQIGAMGAEARKTKGAPSADAAGGADGSGLSLRIIQQQRMRLDARRKEAHTNMADAQKAMASMMPDERKAAEVRAQAAYDAKMKDLDAQDAALVQRLEALQTGGKKGTKGPTLADLPSADAGATPDGGIKFLGFEN